jgi:hypothetical protein
MMGYYGGVRGDFYAGARGDPGFFSFLGKVAKGALGLASGIMPGGGMVSGAISKVLPGRIGGMVSRVGGAIIKHPVLSAAGAAGGMAIGGGALAIHERHAGMAARESECAACTSSNEVRMRAR